MTNIGPEVFLGRKCMEVGGGAGGGCESWAVKSSQDVSLYDVLIDSRDCRCVVLIHDDDCRGEECR